MRNSNRPSCSTWYTTTGGQIWARLMAEVGRKEWHEEGERHKGRQGEEKELEKC